jgi:hypothetical protein
MIQRNVHGTPVKREVIAQRADDLLVVVDQ